MAWRCAVDACVPVQGCSAGLLCCGCGHCRASCRPPGFNLTDGQPPVRSFQSVRALSAEPAAASWQQKPLQPHTAARKQSRLHLVGQPDGRRPGLNPQPPTLGCSPAVPATGPGAMPFTRMPKAPHSSASVLVRLSTAALAAEACACTCSRCQLLNDCRILWSVL